MARDKILSLFTSSGKGGKIKIEGEPLFSLKLTVEFLINKFSTSKIILKKLTQKHHFTLLPKKNFAKNSEKENNVGEDSLAKMIFVTIEGNMINNGVKSFKHLFTITENHKIMTMEIQK